MTNISAQELKNRLDAGEKLNIIDVREPEEYAAGNMGGKLIPLGNIMNMQIEELEGLEDQEVILHCKSGRRSMQAGVMLEQAGFKNVVNLTGGILDWEKLQNS